ncbi:DUF551 domain-containing protein [Escherichia coli]|nr:DUF551 domain-containing protein [Escherichia coli]
MSELVKRGHDKAAQLKSSGGAVSQLISDLATQLDVQLARSNALAAENAGLKDALASLEAEPVGCDACGGNGSVDIDHGEMGIEHIECPKCYTAPPAPVSVPEWTNEQCLEFLSIAFRHAEIKGDLELDDIRLGLKMVNGSRAAMLQGAEPVKEWIPCSERMPERDVDVQVYCADKKEQMVGYMEHNEQDGYFRFASLPNGGGVYCQPTHWMPLPAAPQQEVK